MQSLLVKGVNAQQADLVARLARGCPGWALRAVADDDLMAAHSQYIADLETLLTANRTRRFEYSEQLSRADDTEIQTVLEHWLLYWMDVAREIKTAQPHDDLLLNVDHAQMIAHIASRVALGEVVRQVRGLMDMLRYLQQNVSMRVAIDVFLLQLPVV